ncbi:hypothetical protein IWW38_005687, partial [Coemansia aciculifera]
MTLTIYALGSNSGGQLAQGNMEDVHYLRATQFLSADTDDDSQHLRVHGGGNHAFAWTATTLLGCGSTADGELPVVEETESAEKRRPILCWTPVATPYPECRVQQVACGWNHTLLLDDTGTVYAAGSGAFGQLGGGGGVPRAAALDKWTRVAVTAAAAPEARRVVGVACGMRHSLALDSSGSVFGWGANRSGQLGILPGSNVLTPTLVSKDLPPIAMIACGRSHSILVASDRRTVFVAGQDKYAQHGPATATTTRPSHGSCWHSFRLPRAAVKLCSGWDFGAVLLEPSSTSAGNVVVWGRADQGQMACTVEDGG